jgi:hypothetical protein
VEAGIDLTNGLLEGLFKSTSNSHDFTDGFHAGTNIAVDVLELGQIPARNLGDDVIESGSKLAVVVRVTALGSSGRVCPRPIFAAV